MRTEKQMYDLILDIANKNQYVQAVYMNGSRTNPNVTKDKYMDYDVVFAVTKTDSFLANKKWISAFGEIAILQEPDSNNLGWETNSDHSNSYTWLMLFTDGNRIDLQIKVLDYAIENYLSDTLCLKLLDKENILPEIKPSNDSLYHIKPPTKEMYNGCCNEFFWCLNNVAKGIAREQLPYAHRMYIEIVHTELDKMIEWYIGIEHNFSVTTGMWGKYFKKYLSKEIYQKYINTYSDLNCENLWNAIFISIELFNNIAKQIADKFAFVYNIDDENGLVNYLLAVKNNTL